MGNRERIRGGRTKEPVIKSNFLVVRVKQDPIDLAVSQVIRAHPELIPRPITNPSSQGVKIPDLPFRLLEVPEPVTAKGFDTDSMNYKHRKQPHILLERLAESTGMGLDINPDEREALKKFSGEELEEAIMEGFRRWGREARIRLKRYFNHPDMESNTSS